MTFRVLLAAAVAVLAAAAPGSAQTRFTLAGGGLVPFGDLGDSTDPSLRAELRVERQAVNALGGVSLLSFVAYAAYSDLQLKSEVEDVLVLGDETDPHLLELGGGVRVYSAAAPFFVTGGAAWTRYRPAGAGDARSGADLHGGVGFLLPMGLFLLEPEVTAHAVFLEDADLQFLAATLGLALPF
jgi:hypothetical protein